MMTTHDQLPFTTAQEVVDAFNAGAKFRIIRSDGTTNEVTGFAFPGNGIRCGYPWEAMNCGICGEDAGYPFALDGQRQDDLRGDSRLVLDTPPAEQPKQESKQESKRGDNLDRWLRESLDAPMLERDIEGMAKPQRDVPRKQVSAGMSRNAELGEPPSHHLTFEQDTSARYAAWRVL